MKKRKDNVLAEGEVTGHAHRAVGKKVTVFGDGPERLLNAPHGAEVVHEEHKKQRVDAGEHDISRVREFDPFAEETRNVAD